MNLKTKQQGVALITVMLIVALATTLAVAMMEQQTLSFKKASYTKQSGQAYYYALGIESWAIGRLKQDLRNDLNSTKFDHLKEVWTQKIKLQIVDKTANISGNIVDLNSRFNLNSLVRPTPITSKNAKNPGANPEPDPGANPPPDPGANPPPDPEANPEPPPEPTPKPKPKPNPGKAVKKIPTETDRDQLKRLLTKLQLEPGLADAIGDWIDRDNKQRFPNGAEDTVYLNSQNPYRTANSPFKSVTELKLVKGITEEVYQKLKPYVTALPADSKININTAPEKVIESLSPQFNKLIAQAIINRRNTLPFKKTSEFISYAKQLTGKPNLLPANLKKTIAVSSNYFTSNALIIMRQSHLKLISLLIRNRAQNTVKVVRRGLRTL